MKRYEALETLLSKIDSTLAEKVLDEPLPFVCVKRKTTTKPCLNIQSPWSNKELCVLIMLLTAEAAANTYNNVKAGSVRYFAN